MGIFLANRDAPSRCTATDCLVSTIFVLVDLLKVLSSLICSLW